MGEDGYQLCQRLYTLLRQLLSPPDLVLKLNAPLDVLRMRRSLRSRPLDIADDEDLPRIETLMAEWMQSAPPHSPLIEVDASADNLFAASLPDLAERIRNVL